MYVVRTSAGLLMVDALGGNDAQSTTTQVESQLLPGFETLGLDPAQVKVILVTHGHADHFGGSSYFQERYGAKVYISAADWNLMENPPARGRGGRGPVGSFRRWHVTAVNVVASALAVTAGLGLTVTAALRGLRGTDHP